jgi:hypothetical protein
MDTPKQLNCSSMPGTPWWPPVIRDMYIFLRDLAAARQEFQNLR